MIPGVMWNSNDQNETFKQFKISVLLNIEQMPTQKTQKKNQFYVIKDLEISSVLPLCSDLSSYTQ